MDNDLLYQIALTKVEHIGDVHAKSLLAIYKKAEDVFKAKSGELERLEGIGKIRADSIKKFKAFDACEKEIAFIEKNRIVPVCINSPHYPNRLRNCYDSPMLMYYKGNADLNAYRMISVVGTRNNSDYGRFICEQLIHDLSNQQISIISGLAYGIDSIAHRSAFENNLPTIAVLAHGLDRIYPPTNISMAKNILQNGGWLTDFTSGNKPDKQNFPLRNRITAGLCDALVVIETGVKGGSLITAEIAHSYNKDVLAFPGKTTDNKSAGCNALIKQQKAALIENASDLLNIMGWNEQKKTPRKKQQELFTELSLEEKAITLFLGEKQEVHIDQIISHTRLNYSATAKALLNLEINGIIQVLPGNRYRIL